MTNKEQIMAFYQKVFNEREDAAGFVSPDFVEHYTAPMEKTGVAAFYDRYAMFFAADGTTMKVAKIVAEGDKVAAYIKMRKDDKPFCRATDIFRLRDGKIFWHTATIQPVA